MKKILLFLAVAGFAISCSDDDSTPTNINTDLLVGKWDLVMLNSAGQNVTLNDCDYGTWKEFKENGDFVEEYKCNGEIDTDTSTYTVSGTTITNVVAGDPDSPYVFEIKQLSEDLLVISYKYNDEDNKPQTNILTFNRL